MVSTRQTAFTQVQSVNTNQGLLITVSGRRCVLNRHLPSPRCALTLSISRRHLPQPIAPGANGATAASQYSVGRLKDLEAGGFGQTGARAKQGPAPASGRSTADDATAADPPQT